MSSFSTKTLPSKLRIRAKFRLALWFGRHCNPSCRYFHSVYTNHLLRHCIHSAEEFNDILLLRHTPILVVLHFINWTATPTEFRLLKPTLYEMYIFGSIERITTRSPMSQIRCTATCQFIVT